MKTFHINLIVILSLCTLIGCTPSREELQDQITQYEQSIINTDVYSGQKSTDTLIGLYTEYANNYRTDSITPTYLFRAADLASNTGDADLAIELLNRIISTYPEYHDLAGCYFMIGYTYETNEQYDLAKEAYQIFVDKFPNHILAADTKKMIPYVGMPPEQILNILMDEITNVELTEQQ